MTAMILKNVQCSPYEFGKAGNILIVIFNSVCMKLE